MTNLSFLIMQDQSYLKTVVEAMAGQNHPVESLMLSRLEIYVSFIQLLMSLTYSPIIFLDGVKVPTTNRDERSTELAASN